MVPREEATTAICYCCTVNNLSRFWFFLLVELNQYTWVILKFQHAMIKVMMSSSVSGGGYGLWKEVEGGIMISLLLFPSVATLCISTLEKDGHGFVCWSCLHLHKVCLFVLTLWACLCRINKTIMDLLLKLAPRPLNQLSITESWLGGPEVRLQVIWFSNILPSVVSTFSQAACPPSTWSTSFRRGNWYEEIWERN